MGRCTWMEAYVGEFAIVAKGVAHVNEVWTKLMVQSVGMLEACNQIHAQPRFVACTE